MYLADTNIFLSVFLDQNDSNGSKRFLTETPLNHIYISEFSINSIGVALSKRKKLESFVKFIEDVLINGKMEVLKLDANGLKDLVQAAQQYNLDFDDAYQYAVAVAHGLTIISFDKDFDKTNLGRKTPEQVLGTK